MLRKHRLKACVCKAQTKRRQIQPDLCRIISRSWEEEYLNKIIVKNESKQGWINWILVAVDLVAVGDWMVLRPADRAVTLNDLGMEPLCLVMRGAISMEENGENSNFLDWFWMESLLLMSYFMWSWDVLVHLFPSLSQLLGLKAWSLDSAVLSSARDAKNPQGHCESWEFWRFLMWILMSFIFNSHWICVFFCKNGWYVSTFHVIFFGWKRFHTSKKNSNFFRSCSASLRRLLYICLTLTYWGLDFFLVKFERMVDGGCVYWDGFWMFFFFVWYLHGSSCHPGFLFTKVEPCLESSSCKRGSFVPKSDAFGGLNGIIKHGNPNLFGV